MEEYLEKKGAAGPAQTAARLLEARIGELLGPADEAMKRGKRDPSLMREGLTYHERHFFRLMARREPGIICRGGASRAWIDPPQVRAAKTPEALTYTPAVRRFAVGVLLLLLTAVCTTTRPPAQTAPPTAAVPTAPPGPLTGVSATPAPSSLPRSLPRR